MKNLLLPLIVVCIAATSYIVGGRSQRIQVQQNISASNAQPLAQDFGSRSTEWESVVKGNSSGMHPNEYFDSADWFANLQKRREHGLSRIDYLLAWSALAKKDAAECIRQWAKFKRVNSRDSLEVADVIAEIVCGMSIMDIERLLSANLNEAQRGMLSTSVISALSPVEGIKVWVATAKLGSNMSPSLEIARKITESDSTNKVLLWQGIVECDNLTAEQVSACVSGIFAFAGSPDAALLGKLLESSISTPHSQAIQLGLEKGLRTLDFSQPYNKATLNTILNRDVLDFQLGSALASAFSLWTLKSPAAAAEYLHDNSHSPNSEFAIAGFVQAYKEIDPNVAAIWSNEIKNQAVKDLAAKITVYQN